MFDGLNLHLSEYMPFRVLRTPGGQLESMPHCKVMVFLCHELTAIVWDDIFSPFDCSCQSQVAYQSLGSNTKEVIVNSS